MGLFPSTEASFEKVGHHVLQVQPSSPGDKAGLRPFFDFIIAANNITLQLDQEGVQFNQILKANLESPIKLHVYNTQYEKLRVVELQPSAHWGGPGFAGISIRFCSFEHASELVWRVLETFPSSPAAEAGLISGSDYIVGTPDHIFADSEDLFTLINMHENKPVQLYVYSSLTEDIRLVTLTPRIWGGGGFLGCDIGFGLLHRIPPPRLSYSAASVDTEPEVVLRPQPFYPNHNPNQQEGNAQTVPMGYPGLVPKSPVSVPYAGSSHYMQVPETSSMPAISPPIPSATIASAPLAQKDISTEPALDDSKLTAVDPSAFVARSTSSPLPALVPSVVPDSAAPLPRSPSSILSSTSVPPAVTGTSLDPTDSESAVDYTPSVASEVPTSDGDAFNASDEVLASFSEQQQPLTLGPEEDTPTSS